MAHYIAELMQNAEEASTEERATKMQLCHDAILSLWEHRYTFVNGKRPFEGLEPVLQTLKDLSIEGGRQRYFRCLYTNDDITNENDEVQYWLRFIDELDYSAKTIIQYCLVHAAQNVLDQSMEWVKLAEVADVEESIEFPIIRMITDESDLLKVPDPSSEERKRIEERIERLEKFSQMATKVVTDLRNRSPLVHL